MPWQHLTLETREVVEQMAWRGEHPEGRGCRAGLCPEHDLPRAGTERAGQGALGILLPKRRNPVGILNIAGEGRQRTIIWEMPTNR